MKIWNGSNGELEGVVRHDDWVMDVSCSRDGKNVVSVAKDGTGSVWDISNRRRLVLLRHPEYSTVNTVAFSSDGEKLMTSTDAEVIIWEIPGGNEIVRWSHENGIIHSNFSPDGERVVISSYDNTASVWNAGTARRLAVLPHDDMVQYSLFSPDGQIVASGSFDGTVRIWKTRSGEMLAELDHGEAIGAMGFSPDSSRLVTASGVGEFKAELWNLENSEKIATFNHESTIEQVVFSADGSLIATVGLDKVSIWNASSGEHKVDLDGAKWVRHVEFSPDVRKIITASNVALREAGGAAVWDSGTGERLFDLGVDIDVNDVHYSADGGFIVGATDEHAAMVWGAQSGHLLATFQHGDAVNRSAVNKSGIIATGSKDGTAALWAAPPSIEDILSDPFEYLPRNTTCLTPQERERFSLSPLTDKQWVERRCGQFAENY